MPRKPEDIFRDKIEFLLKSEKSLDKAVREHQNKLYELLISEYLPLFETKDGLIIDNPKNAALINKLDSFFVRLEKAMYRDVISPFAANLLQSAESSAEYYVALGFKKSVVNKLLKNKIDLENRLGITPKGKLRKSGYLYKLGQTDVVRQQLLNYVISNLTGDVSFRNFQLGFRNLVKGNRRVKSLPTTGVLQRYFSQFAYDTFSQMDAVANKQFADNLQLKHFIYEGSLIDTSRDFCKKRAGKAFTVEETKTWKNDPDLIDPKTKDAYNPLIDRGRYNCRHTIRYITEALYNELTK